MVVFHGIRLGQVPKEPQPEGLDPLRDWQAACSDPKDFPQTPGVEGIKALSQGRSMSRTHRAGLGGCKSCRGAPW